MIKPQNLITPEAGQAKRGEQGHLGYLLRQAAHAFRMRVEHQLQELSLTQPQFAVLTMLAAYPGLSNADIARLAMLTPQTISVTVANLLKAGLVQRRPHQIHGRIQHIELTETGQQTLDAAKLRVYAFEASLQEGFSDAEQAAIRRWLVALATDQPKGQRQLWQDTAQ
jgi:DNA-binding MarR family transcriptional regulator